MKTMLNSFQKGERSLCEALYRYVVNLFCVCVDVDECSLGFSNGGCDHVCVNTPGNYSCVCRDGYIKLQQGRICKGL